MIDRKYPEFICVVPKLEGLGGMVSFQKRGIHTTYNLEDHHNQAILVIGGTRQLSKLWQARRRGIRIVQRLDGLNWLHRKQKTGIRYYIRSETNNLLLAFIRRYVADHIVYQSEFSRRWWQLSYGNLSTSSQVVYNGIDLDAYSPDGPHQRPVDHFRILLVEGHLGKRNAQGLNSALGMLQLLNDVHHLPTHLVVVGDISPQVQAELSSKAAGAINWSGVLPREQIPQTDRSAHVLFSADLNAACPNSVIEALACGLPVISFDTGALSEIVKDGAGLVVPYGSDYWNLEPPVLPPLAQAAARILTENDSFRQAARLRAEAAFSLDRMIDGYLEAFSG